MILSLNKRGVILLTVIGILLVVGFLSVVSLTLMTSEARLGMHQINKIRAYYIGMGALHWAQAQKRLGLNPAHNGPTMPGGTTKLPPGFELKIEEKNPPAGSPAWSTGTKEIDINVKYPTS